MASDPTADSDRLGGVRHRSGLVYCAERGSMALVNLVERDATPTPIRFVLWCSMRQCGECSERCLRSELVRSPA